MRHKSSFFYIKDFYTVQHQKGNQQLRSPIVTGKTKK